MSACLSALAIITRGAEAQEESSLQLTLTPLSLHMFLGLEADKPALDLKQLINFLMVMLKIY